MNLNFRFARSFLVSIPVFAIVFTTPLRAANDEKLHYLSADRPDAVALLAPPPLPDSPEQKYDLTEVITVHDDCPSNEVAAALFEDKGLFIDYFASIVGGLDKLPVTKTFLERVHKDAQHAVGTAKNYWKRPRPYAVDPDLLVGKMEKSFSYPSGHSTESMTLALVLADLFPDKRGALIAKAREIGWHRVEIARHYPTDIFAGRVFAQAIIREMEKSPDFQKDLAAAKAEIASTRQ